MGSTQQRLDLGVGLIALGAVDVVWPDISDLVDVVEVEPQTLWEGAAGARRRIAPEPLAWLRGLDRPLLSHGVGFPVGGTTAPEPDGVAASARSARELGAVHWSEHLAFNRAGDRFAGFLLPPVQTPEAVAAAARHIASYQDRLDRPFLVETPTNYLQPVAGDLRDGEYVAAVAEAADCGILLDLHNIWTNERNGRQSVDDYLADLPLDRVGEVHLAGGYETAGYYLDAHVGAVDPALLEIAARVVPRLPRVRALVFEAVPQSVAVLGVEGLREVLASLHALASLPVAGSAPLPAGPSGSVASSGEPVARERRTTAEREAELLAYTTRASDHLGSPDPGADLMRALTDEGRLSLLVEGHGAELGGLITAHGSDGARALLRRFLAETPASAWPEEQGRAFRAWLRSQPAASPAAAATAAPASVIRNRESIR
ncbi:MAG: DUF692 family protein [Nocardioidaceae bacterium]